MSNCEKCPHDLFWHEDEWGHVCLECSGMMAGGQLTPAALDILATPGEDAG